MDKLNSIYWHDGLLDDIHVSIGKDKSFIQLKVRVYGDPESSSRDSLDVRFLDVSSCLFSFDVNELLDNLSAGNISNGYSKISNEELRLFTYRMYLSDGYIEIISKGVEVSGTNGVI
jgi:hypothetical protein